MENEFVVITGASSGIGLEFAKRFARDGYSLILVSRREELLKEIQENLKCNFGVEVHYFACDLTDSEKIRPLFQFLLSFKPTILVNNAGFANFGEFACIELEKQLELIDLNIKALTMMTKLFLELHQEPRNLRILNVSSMAGLLPGPYISVYAASKAYVYSFSQSLASELQSRDVQVSVLCPSDVRTGFQERAGISHTGLKMSTPEAMVTTAYKSFMRGKRVIIPSKMMSLMKSILKILPESRVADSIYRQRSRLEKNESL